MGFWKVRRKMVLSPTKGFAALEIVVDVAEEDGRMEGRKLLVDLVMRSSVANGNFKPKATTNRCCTKLPPFPTRYREQEGLC